MHKSKPRKETELLEAATDDPLSNAAEMFALTAVDPILSQT